MSSESADGAARAAPIPCSRSGRKEHPAGGGEAPDERAQGEEGDPGQKDAAPTEQVAGTGPEEQQARRR